MIINPLPTDKINTARAEDKTSSASSHPLVLFQCDAFQNKVTSLKDILVFLSLWDELLHVLPNTCWWFLSNRVTRSW